LGLSKAEHLRQSAATLDPALQETEMRPLPSAPLCGLDEIARRVFHGIAASALMRSHHGQPTSRRDFLKSLTAAALGGAAAAPLPSLADAEASEQETRALVRLNPQPGGKAADFEAAQIRGTLQPEGPYHGVTRLFHRGSGRQFIDERYAALNLFRLFSVNQGMGQPRTMERTITPSATALQIHWAPTEAHQGEITARYEVREPNEIGRAHV